MQRIFYAGDSVLTGTDIAQAVLAYAQALAGKQSSATVDIPVLLSTGERGEASILIGPSSQLFSETPEEESASELTDDALVQHLTELAGALGVARPVVESAADIAAQHRDDVDLDLDFDPPTHARE
ncbi:hypothetical protein C1I63_00530 [Rathayibacter caricis DSM 15933]|uniref:Uncharacterized protein n=1 Tax=Rathayibacter caricis DSM 15933 TaxID=1328867 RepID=A0A2T4UPP0_9MICO|nr:hypothetical protein [Rathayibacter caricis]PTL71489.1 hypothetical protein C1I63_00530 [Rathayibacter caricis DSM 15933]